MQLTAQQERKLRDLLSSLIDQAGARVAVQPQQSSDGYWFGGGNVVAFQDAIWLCGRYRNAGDSRTGTQAGERGVSCDVFRSDRAGETFERVAGWTKAELSHDADVLSIEGSALHQLSDGSWELFVATEKAEAYPEPFAEYQKPGTGVWSIDRMRGPAPDRMDPRSLRRVLSGLGPEHLHVKDPVVYGGRDSFRMLFSTHPVSWASSNTGLATRLDKEVEQQVESWQVVTRGAVWDVAATRITDRLEIPQVGVMHDTPRLEILFYDGAESMRRQPENPRGKRRPRGWSCEEIGGALWAPLDRLQEARRLSRLEPWFTSPYGTGSSRYVSTLTVAEGIHAFWQQARDDGSQPLVTNFLGRRRLEELLT